MVSTESYMEVLNHSVVHLKLMLTLYANDTRIKIKMIKNS